MGANIVLNILNNNTMFAALITGGNSLTMEGTGTLQLVAANTYTAPRRCWAAPCF